MDLRHIRIIDQLTSSILSEHLTDPDHPKR
jgi:hypothetical protein